MPILDWLVNMVNSGLLIFLAVAEPRISTKSAKSREIHKSTRNPAKFVRNLTKYMSAQYIWKLSWLLGLLTCCKHANLPGNFFALASKQHPTGKQRCKNPGVPSEDRGNWWWECDGLSCVRFSWRMLRLVKDYALYVYLTYKGDDLFRNGSAHEW